MSTCLVTTLSEAVDDSQLLTLDEFDIPIKTSSVSWLVLQAWIGKTVTAKIIGEGYFTDSTGTSNLGMTQSAGSTALTFYYSPGEYTIRITNKSGLYRMDHHNTATFELENLMGVGAKLLNMAGAIPKGDISYINYIPNLEGIYINGSKVYGKYSDIESNKLARFRVIYPQNIQGNVSDFIGCMKTDALEIAIQNSDISGNVSEFASLTSLQTLQLDGCANITGNTSSLANLANLTTFTYANTAITGTWPLT